MELVNKEPPALVIKKEDEKELSLVNSLVLPKGHSIWSLDVKTGKYQRVDIEAKARMGYDGDVKKSQTVFSEKGVTYYTALNEKNAKRKAIKYAAELTRKYEAHMASIKE